jgi:hypothetical protein
MPQKGIALDDSQDVGNIFLYYEMKKALVAEMQTNWAPLVNLKNSKPS